MNIERIKRLAGLIKDNCSLCNFLGKYEKEDLVAGTIHACVTNYEKRGEAFSFKGNISDNQLFQSGTYYNALVRDGYFTEGTYEGKATIIPTDKLLTDLEKFFNLEVEA